MPRFNGFSEGKANLTPIPGAFFNELLPEIDHLGELKVSLYVFWRLNRMEGTFRSLRRSDLAGDQQFDARVGRRPSQKAEECLDEALRRAVARGALLEVSLVLKDQPEPLYFLNSPKGRAAHGSDPPG
jgi:DNA replication protein